MSNLLKILLITASPLWLLAAASVMVPAWSPQAPVHPQQAQGVPHVAPSVDVIPAVAPEPDLGPRIDESVASASARNHVSLTLATGETAAILQRHFSELAFATEAAAAEIATYENCLHLITLMASDQLRGRTDARIRLARLVEKAVTPTISPCQRDLDAALGKFDRELTASTLALATDLAAIQPNDTSTSIAHVSANLDGLSLEAALRELGLHGAVLTPVAMVDLHAMLNTRLVGRLIAKGLRMAKWIFARPIAAAAAEAGLVVADGPLPIGDAIAVIGAVWTAYDIYSLRASFEVELQFAARQALLSVRRDMEQQVFDALRGRLAEHMTMQSRLHHAARMWLQPETPTPHETKD